MNNRNFLGIKNVFDDKFPNNYINDVAGWGISKDLLHTKLDDGTNKLITLDLDFGYKCDLSCPHCFKNMGGNKNTAMSFDETMKIIKDAKKLGLKYIKVIGAGEPFDNPMFLDFLIEAHRLGIIVAVFTKGYILGSDEKAKLYFGKHGINNSEELIDFLYKLNVSILMGFNSFNDEIQGEFIGIKDKNELQNFINVRNRAIKLLVDRGFNEYIEGKATRLALIAAPVKPINIDEIFDIYTWGRRKNIYVVICPTTISGLGKKELKTQKENEDFDKFINKLKNIYVDIYKWNIENGLMTYEQFLEEGVSLYGGAHPCNQVAGGMYITLNGRVLRCPGRDNKGYTESKDVRIEGIKTVWLNSQNYQLAEGDDFNYHCIARDEVYLNSYNFYEDIYNNVKSYFNEKYKF